MKILLVDDEPTIRNAWAQILEIKEHDVYACATAGEALQALKNFKAEMAIIDLRLNAINDLDGDELVSAMRSNHNYIPVVMMSGNATSDKYLKRIKAVTSNILPKPFNLEELLSAIEQAVAV